MIISRILNRRPVNGRLVNRTLVNRTLISRGLGVTVAAATLAVAAPADAAPQWLTPQTVSQPGQDASNPRVAFDQGGDAVAVWQSTGVHTVIMASARPTGGAFSAPQTLSDAGESSTHPDVASDGQGDAVAVWLRFDGANQRVQAAYRPAGGSFGTPQTLSAVGYEAREPHVAMNASGVAVIVWSLASGLSEKVQSSSAAPGGVFGEPVDLTMFTMVASVPRIALDSHGDAIAVWDGWDGAKIRIEDAMRPAGGSFGSPRFLSPSGYNADTPQVVLDATGDALAVWRFDGPPASTVEGDYRQAGGEFGVPQTVPAPSSQPAQAPQVAFDGQGDGVVAWQQSDGKELRVDASIRQPGTTGTFAAQTTLDPGGQEAYEPRIAGDGLSGTIVSWKTFNGANYTAQAAVRPAGGSFSPATTVSAAGPQEGVPAVGIDAQGNGIAVWSRSNGPNYLLEAAGYDGAGPLLRGLTLPSQGLIGQSLQFFVAPLDVWSPVLSEGFSFGDGASASGVSAVHTYTSAGTYQVTAAATDVLGNVTTVTRTLTIGVPGAAGSPGVSAVHCTLATARTQKLLGKGIVTASAMCGAGLEASLSGRLTVPVVRSRGRGHGRSAKTSTLRGFTLESVPVGLVAGRQTAVHLALSSGALHAVLAALQRHRHVSLYLTLAGAPGAGSGVHVQAHVASLALVRHAPARHTRR